MSRLLRAVTRAQAKRQAAYDQYVQAVEAAHKEHTLEEIGQAAGITRQGVRYLLNPDPRKQP